MGMLCIFISIATFAQSHGEKPALFSAYPVSLNISESIFQEIFGLSANQETVLHFTSNFSFPCKVLRNEVKYSNMQTVIIRSSAFDNAMMQVTKITNRDQSVTYKGRIINERSADGFEIMKTEAGIYQLKKFETDHILEPCFQ